MFILAKYILKFGGCYCYTITKKYTTESLDFALKIYNRYENHNIIKNKQKLITKILKENFEERIINEEG